MADNEVVTEAEIVDLLADANGSLKLGDWEGNAEDFRKNFIPQSELKGMREKDKAEISAQVAAQVDKHKAEFLATQQAQAMQRTAQPPPQAGNSFQSGLDSIYATADEKHGGYIHTDQMRGFITQMVGAINNEFQTRDRMTNHLGKKLDEWYGQSNERARTLDTLAGTHSDGVWSKYMDELSDKYPTLPRATITALASGYEAGDSDTSDQLREGISAAIGEHVQGMDAHRETARVAKREEAQKLQNVGMPGVAAAAVPSKPDKPLGSADEIANHFFGDAPAS